MKITKRQLRRIIKEEKALIETYNSMSSRSRSLANAAKRQFAKDYPEVQVGIDGREGWITVNGNKAVNMSQASGSPLSMDDIIDKMKQAYLGHDMLSREVPELTGGRKSTWQVRKERELGESKMKITKNQLRRIIKEEKAKPLRESALDDPGGVSIPPEELIARLEKISSLVAEVDGYLSAYFRGDEDGSDAAFDTNGDVEYHLQQLLGDLKGM